MKFYKNLLLMIIAFAALLAAYIFIPQNNDKNKNSADYTGEVKGTIILKTFKVADLAEVSLNNDKGALRLKRVGQAWKMTEPADYNLDWLSTDGFIKDVCSLKALDIVDKNPGSLENFGLKNPKGILSVKTNKGTSTLFLIGDKLPIGEGYYLKTSDGNTVYSVDNYTAGDILRSASDFRDKTIMNANAGDISYVAVTKNAKEIFRFSKVKNEWNVISAEGTKTGDNTAITSVLNKLSSLKAKGFADSTVNEDKDYCLGDSSSKIIIGFAKQPEIKLIVGKSKDETSNYLKVEGSNQVFTVEQSDIDVATKNMNEFIKK